MAEERNLGVARATDDAAAGDEDSTKAELQRRMEEARESITQTVTEIKDTVSNQYQAVRQSVTEALDWREQYRRRPVAWSVGALSVGLLVGYSLGGVFTGDGSDDEDYLSYMDDDDPASGVSSAYEGGRGATASVRSAAPAAPAYAAPLMAGSGRAASSYSPPASQSATGDYSSAAYGGGDESAESDKPGILERFKETRAYDRLQEEVSTLGDRFIDELSKVGTTVVLPMLFSKIKDMFGVDLSHKEQGTGATTAGARAAGTTPASTGGTQAAAPGSATQGGGISGGGSPV
jgi:ElaB/YqjD/DUF883 family membrane-anchored ribosome-binding protein